MRTCATCLYADNGKTRLCMRKNGMTECWNDKKHKHWRPRPMDILSPSLRALVGFYKKYGNEETK
jgi:hypothetical protein